jgi:Mg2+ and Co2+ transporter CorA
MMAQKDNDVNIEISRATKADSVAMKSIAIVTLTFLPATYVSALLGMNLFNFDPNAHGGHITYSPDLWIYFLSSILLSVAVLAIWWVWQRREDMIGDAKGTRFKALSAVP